MIAKFYYLTEELKENFSTKLLNETVKCFTDELMVKDLLIDDKKSKVSLNGLPIEFYNEIGKEFVLDLEEFPQQYFLFWESILGFFQPKTLTLFLEISKKISNNSDASDYINGIIESDNGKPEIALFYFNRIDDFASCYFIGLCYLELENYENAIRNLVLFLNDFEELQIKVLETSKIDFSENSHYIVTIWNVYNNLGYLYNRISDFDNAKLYYEKSLMLVNIEKNYEINFNQKLEVDDFTIFVNNYLWTLEKTGNYKKCIEILDFVITKCPNDIFYKNQRAKFIEKTEKHAFANEIISNLFKVKKPFNINSFQETKLISKEKILEDMIVEQIKYGFKVFGKQLEIYQDDEIFGRQYYIQSVNGILDLLLIDKTNDILYVVELKRNEAGIEVVEQIENYIKGLTSQLKREVRGIIR
jgi:tetratricopeptide (TPR) repeat protein